MPLAIVTRRTAYRPLRRSTFFLSFLIFVGLGIPYITHHYIYNRAPSSGHRQPSSSAFQQHATTTSTRIRSTSLPLASTLPHLLQLYNTTWLSSLFICRSPLQSRPRISHPSWPAQGGVHDPLWNDTLDRNVFLAGDYVMNGLEWLYRSSSSCRPRPKMKRFPEWWEATFDEKTHPTLVRAWREELGLPVAVLDGWDRAQDAAQDLSNAGTRVESAVDLLLFRETMALGEVVRAFGQACGIGIRHVRDKDEVRIEENGWWRSRGPLAEALVAGRMRETRWERASRVGRKWLGSQWFGWARDNKTEDPQHAQPQDHAQWTDQDTAFCQQSMGGRKHILFSPRETAVWAANMTLASVFREQSEERLDEILAAIPVLEQALEGLVRELRAFEGLVSTWHDGAQYGRSVGVDASDFPIPISSLMTWFRRMTKKVPESEWGEHLVDTEAPVEDLLQYVAAARDEIRAMRLFGERAVVAAQNAQTRARRTADEFRRMRAMLMGVVGSEGRRVEVTSSDGHPVEEVVTVTHTTMGVDELCKIAGDLGRVWEAMLRYDRDMASEWAALTNEWMRWS